MEMMQVHGRSQKRNHDLYLLLLGLKEKKPETELDAQILIDVEYTRDGE